ncbi:MAG: ATP-binding cassette domain-containing protein [Syntrophaceae bacterium]|nr:ATP-binding cassette domain-containing protein [Syntrophaceae bacterium]
MIDLREVSFSYPSAAGGSRPVFDRLSLSIPRGRYVFLMGPNGSGKSTLGKLVKGLLSPSSGQVRIAGQPLKPGEISPRIGYLFSNPENQIVSSLVEEDVAFGPGNRGLEPALLALRVEESLRRVGMEAYRRHAPHLLSGGQQQKIVIAGILAMECEALVLDEPTSMIDPESRREILDLFLKLHREKSLTFLHISHSLEDALRSEELIYLEEGRVLYSGPPEEFLTSPRFSESCPLQIPPLLRLVRGLRDRGHSLPPGIRSYDELKRALLGHSLFLDTRENKNL